nr:MAG: hypothetical protein [Phoenicurus auroreus ambidensovirus]
MTEKVSDVELFCQVLEKFPGARSIDWDEALGVAESWMIPTVTSWAALSTAHGAIKDLEIESLTSCLTDLRETAHTMCLIFLSPLQSKKLMNWVAALLNQSDNQSVRSLSLANTMNTSTSSMPARTVTEVADVTYSSTATATLSLKDRMKLAASVPPSDVQIGKMSW